MLYRRVPLETPPEALAAHARDILRSVGYSEPPVDTAMGFYEGKEFLHYIAHNDKSKTRWDHLETGAFVFWYRGSPQPLAAANILSAAPADEPWSGTVWTDDPPLDESRMTLVQLNPLGRLTQFVAVPPQVEKPAGAASSPDWAPLFSAAELDPSKWTAAQPEWTPPVYSDTRAAWTGLLTERPDVPMRIEAAAYRGRPVYFELIGPWTSPSRMQPNQQTAGGQAFLVIFIVLLLAMLVVGAMLARRNLRLGRGDRRGAFRLAAFVFAASAVAWLFGASRLGPRGRTLALPRVFGLGASVVLLLLGPLHCHGTLCAPPLACHAGFLEPLAGGRLSRSVGGPRCACRLCYGGVCAKSFKIGVVCSLLARPSSAATTFRPGLAVSRSPHDHCLSIEHLGPFAFSRICVSVCPGSFPGPVAQGVGGRGRMGPFPHSLLLSGERVCSRCRGAGSDLERCHCVSAETARIAVAVGCIHLRRSPDEFSPNYPRVRVVRRPQYGRDSADGRDRALRLLHLSGGSADFRRSRARGVSCHSCHRTIAQWLHLGRDYATAPAPTCPCAQHTHVCAAWFGGKTSLLRQGIASGWPGTIDSLDMPWARVTNLRIALEWAWRWS
jgi:hypothetical protein